MVSRIIVSYFSLVVSKKTESGTYTGTVDSEGRMRGFGTAHYEFGDKWLGTWIDGEKHGFCG